jgi:Serine carboxypeptidase S28
MPHGYGSIVAVKDSDNPPSPCTTETHESRQWQPKKSFLAVMAAVALLGCAGSQFFSQKDDAIMMTTATFRPYHSHPTILASPKVDVLLDNSLDVQPLWHDQFLDHIGQDTEHSHHIKTFKQRFLKKSEHWKGPGYPIFVIMGGEGPIDPPMLYQFVHDGLAETFGAFVLEPEHRFYGETHPVEHPTLHDFIKYLTPDQALADAVNLIQYTRDELGCHTDPTSPNYCPVITFGGSYPGFLSFALRFRYGDYIDAAYASSAPLHLVSDR